ncbi:putative nucleotidyltransferase substrate binding domain-containing protein [Pseudonocardia sp.]|uniref:putative nucleotidyltransferase substrate binding domain-containing protein n=1 Tax=Pseudonocardia sp. TaxID=60912 RepID=UPI00262F20F9|nr:putative nucleotidyltransferase substrate binding domain-containing protein [Pseudonocardia sp.]MCW2720838.1 guaB 1 [Pseudonocardia sp.]
MDGLARFLGANPPFCSLSESELESVAAAARVVDHPAGALILDAFTTPGEDLFVVMTGQVELWTTGGAQDEPADEIIGPGCVFGHSTALTGAAVGPRAVALGPVRLVEIPRKGVASVFSSPDGVRFLVQDLSVDRVRPQVPPRFRTVDELVVSAPVIGEADMTVTEAARVMTERSSSYLAVPQGNGQFGMLTDTVLREHVVAAGRPGDTPVADVMIRRAMTARAGTPTADVLHQLAEHRLDHLLVVDASGELRGAVDPQDFLTSPSGAGMVLRENVRRAGSADQVVALARQLPVLLGDLVRQRREASETTAVYSTVLDAIQRRVLSLVLAGRPELDEAEVTWMLLGSNGRREPTLGSDIDSAVVFAESVDTPARAAAYRSAFAEVADVLRRAGLRVDRHGATPGSPAFSRTRSQWRAAAQQWLVSPLDDQGMLMASLLLDGRPIQGDPAQPVVNEVFADVRDHPGTMKLLVRESLSHRAQLRSVRDVLAGRGGTFDLKTHALRPVVEIARWAALSVRSPELSTRARLSAASGSMLLPTEQAQTLIEVFEVLQRVRLRQQLAQFERGERVSDVVWMRRLAPLDRSLVAQSVREISTVQKRLYNILQYTSPQEWGARADL